MCRSCNTPFHGKYCQQCSFCGHPAHNENLCGTGVVRNIPYIQGMEVSIGCQCKEERYDRA